MAPLNILTVDDSMLTLRKLQAMLEDIGHKVVGTAGTGAEALEAYRSHNPDLVTMDITMPDMNGIQATKAIRAEFANAKIVMVTSHGQEAMVRDALKAGAMGYVLKPIKPEKLKDMIGRIVEQS